MSFFFCWSFWIDYNLLKWIHCTCAMLKINVRSPFCFFYLCCRIFVNGFNQVWAFFFSNTSCFFSDMFIFFLSIFKYMPIQELINELLLNNLYFLLQFTTFFNTTILALYVLCRLTSHFILDLLRKLKYVCVYGH